MGYESGWSTRQELVDHLTRTRRVSVPFYADGSQEKSIIFDGNAEQLRWREVGTRTAVARFASGNSLWIVEETTYDEWYCIAENCERTMRCIEHCSMSIDRNNGFPVWGFKAESEAMYPYAVSCPLKFLDMVPEPASASRGAFLGFEFDEVGRPKRDVDDQIIERYDGVPWRAHVRAYWARRRRPVGLQVGDVYDFPEGCRPRSIEITYAKGRAIRGKSPDGLTYRIQPKDLHAGAKRAPAPEPATDEAPEQLGFAV